MAESTPYGELPDIGQEYWDLNPVLNGIIGDLTGRLSEENLGDIRDVYAAVEGATSANDALMTAVAADTGSSFYAQQSTRLNEKVPKVAPNTVIGPNTPATLSGTQNVIVGDQAMEQATDANKTVAIGRHALGNTLKSLDNIGIGDNALSNVQAITSSYDQAQQEGTRNVAIGGQAGYFLNQGVGSVFIGRNAGQNVTDARGVVAIGRMAVCGNGPVGLSGSIENVAPWGTGTPYVTAIGDQAARWNISIQNTAVGGRALENNKISPNNTAVGALALTALENNLGPHGGATTTLNITGTYSQTGNTLTITATGHGATAGNYVYFRLTSGAAATFQSDQAVATVTSVIDSTAFTVTSPVSMTASGDALLVSRESPAGAAVSVDNTAVGYGAAGAVVTGYENTAVGRSALSNLASGNWNTVVGRSAMALATSGDNNTVIGTRALQDMTGPDLATVVGRDAFRKTPTGTAITTQNWTQITGIGYDARVSGSNQVQLGGPGSTTYAYGAVQDRSDERDKADIETTPLGLDFINAIEPVQFRWDMRDDYEDGVRDGSKKRERLHQGVIAQQVKSVADEMGVDFAGLQHHEIAGGDDVYTVGYAEFIAPMMKAIQELSAQNADLLSRIEALEAKGGE